MENPIPLRTVLLLLAVLAAAIPLHSQEGPVDYTLWNQILARHYDPARGMNYKALKAEDGAALKALQQKLAAVDVSALSRPDQLAYWINLYNVSTVATVVAGYPTKSIRDLSTDPIVRLNVFKKETVPIRGGKTSLNAIENEKIRRGFRDPRIHFAINCAARSCPPIRPEAYVGARLDEQLDDQARRFLNGPLGVRLEKDGDGGGVKLVTTMIVKWFKEDFEDWGGGRVAFLRKYLTPDKQKRIDAAKGKVKLDFYDYDWALNDTSQ